MKLWETKKIEFLTRREKAILSFGADIKSSIAFAGKNEVFLSFSRASLDDAEIWGNFEKSAADFTIKKCLPEIIAVDMHPDYKSSNLGRKLAEEKKIPAIEIQHHHAHAAACMFENNINEALAFTFDGTGYGTDSQIWGAELFHVRDRTAARIASFKPVPLPGGDIAVFEPARQLTGRLYAAEIDIKEYFSKRNISLLEKAEIWRVQCEKKINAPLSHSAGRLFDSVSYALGLCPEKISGDAQAPIILQQAAERAAKNPPKFKNSDFFSSHEEGQMLFIDWSPFFANFANAAFYEKLNKEITALNFHRAVCEAMITMANFASDKRDLPVVFSGGVFLNSLLCGLLLENFPKNGFKCFFHKELPCGDECIALGQIAAEQLNLQVNIQRPTAETAVLSV